MAKNTVGEERDLLTAALSGNSSSPAALESLRVRFAPMIKKLARRFAWDADSAEDVGQEGYLALVEALPLYDPSRGVRLGTFVHQRARSRMLHWRRSQRRAFSLVHPDGRGRLRSLDEEIESADEGKLTLHDVVPADEDPRSHGAHVLLLQRIVRNAMLGLAKRQSEALRLLFWGGLSPSEIAKRLGVSRPRVTVLVQAGLSNLRGELAHQV